MKQFKDIQIPFLRTAYNYDTMEASDATAIHFPEPTLCVQSQADETDINNIVRRFGLTAELPVGIRAPSYGDFEGIFDYQSALNTIMQADSAFMEMPADVRKRFDNDAGKFLEFVNDDANYAEAQKLGLVLPKTEMATEVIDIPKVDQ